MKLNPAYWDSYLELLATIRNQEHLDLLVIQHEFGFFHAQKEFFYAFLKSVDIPVVLAFHTVLPNPNRDQKHYLQKLASVVTKLVVMTKKSNEILENDYEISAGKIKIIAHGTHLTEHKDKQILKQKYNLESNLVLATFGLLSEGKGIETTLRALPKLIENQPNILFLILGKTHPTIVLNEGEKYREHLENIVDELQLSKHVRFVNKYIQLEELIDYLQLTDVYVFSSKDPHQAVSGTISYAMSCACPIVASKIRNQHLVHQSLQDLVIYHNIIVKYT
jgi:glycosyltransferase involved in cell wall biosynthesis